MSQQDSKIVSSFKRQNHLLWLLLGLGFSLWLCSQLDLNTVTSVGLLLGLLVAYNYAGRWAANLIARSVLRSEQPEPCVALFVPTVKIGVLFSLLSTVFHLALLGISHSARLLDSLPHTSGQILLRAAIFPFLACVGAACTVSSTACPESPEVVQYPKNSGFSTPTD
jgi:hypothetical protein